MLSILSDELLLELLSHLGPADLTRAGSASKALYCYCRHDEVWKALVLQVGLVKVSGCVPGSVTPCKLVKVKHWEVCQTPDTVCSTVLSL